MVHAQFRSKGEGMCNAGLQEVAPTIVKDMRIAARGAAVPEKRGRHQNGPSKVGCNHNRIGDTERSRKLHNPGFQRPLCRFGASPSNCVAAVRGGRLGLSDAIVHVSESGSDRVSVAVSAHS